jgi:hypothetical protein
LIGGLHRIWGPGRWAVKDLFREGKVTRIIMRGEEGKTLLDIPVMAGAVGTVLFPG